MLKRLEERKKRLRKEQSKQNPEPEKPEPAVDPAVLERAAAAAMGGFDFSSAKGLDANLLQTLMNGGSAPQVASCPPGLKPGEKPTKAESGAGNFVNMPSENPISIPGLPAGWKFGDAMPTGTPREEDQETAQQQKNANPLDVVTSRKRKRRPEQPVIFQVYHLLKIFTGEDG